METSGGTVHFSVSVMKTQKYTIEEIFEKKLLFLIPFYIFSHEKQFGEYDTDMEKLEALKKEYIMITKRLNQLMEAGEISVYTFRTIVEMSGRVLENIAQNFKNVREGVKSVMGGRILEYEAKTILNKGKIEGKMEGRIEGKKEGKMEQARETAEKLRIVGMDETMIADMVNVSVALIREWFQKAPV